MTLAIAINTRELRARLALCLEKDTPPVTNEYGHLTYQSIGVLRETLIEAVDCTDSQGGATMLVSMPSPARVEAWGIDTAFDGEGLLDGIDAYVWLAIPGLGSDAQPQHRISVTKWIGRISAEDLLPGAEPAAAPPAVLQGEAVASAPTGAAEAGPVLLADQVVGLALLAAAELNREISQFEGFFSALHTTP